MLTCWSEQTELEAHRAEDTLDIKSVYSADFTKVLSGQIVLRVPERIITAETERCSLCGRLRVMKRNPPI